MFVLAWKRLHPERGVLGAPGCAGPVLPGRAQVGRPDLDPWCRVAQPGVLQPHHRARVPAASATAAAGG